MTSGWTDLAAGWTDLAVENFRRLPPRPTSGLATLLAEDFFFLDDDDLVLLADGLLLDWRVPLLVDEEFFGFFAVANKSSLGRSWRLLGRSRR